MKEAPAAHNKPNKARILTKAFFRACGSLDLSRKDISDLLGISEPTISRLIAADGVILLDSKEGEIARFFLRLVRSLDGLLGGNEANMRVWLRASNTYLGGTPLEMIKTIGGLVHVTDYLDAMRGKV